MAELARILLADDELNLLQAMVRGLRYLFDVVTAPGGQAALDLLRSEPPFAVIVSDLRMPGMDGIKLLRHAREVAPDTVRMLFTGNADLDDAIGAVNEGSIFRFISKPCPLPIFKSALDSAVQQYHLITSERVLLEQTLHGSVKALTDVLALVSPLAFGRGSRACQYAEDLAVRCGLAEKWSAGVAAMLSQIGCVTLPGEALEKLYHGRPVTKEEQAMIDRVPAVTEHLLANIPRLEPVRNILRYQHKQYNGEGRPADGVRGEDIPWGSRALKIILDFDALESQGAPAQQALDVLQSRAGWYDPAILKTFAELCGGAASQVEMKEVALRDVKPGMVFAEDIKTGRGLLLIARGQEVTLSLIERIMNFSPGLGVKEPILVIIRDDAKSENAS